MKLCICTLFERDYHHGVAALVNSLVRCGYAGRVYAGYRGELPAWAARAEPTNERPASRVLAVTKGCDIEFVRLDTTAHFTNIKPDFMLRIMTEDDLESDGILYLDPDITVVAKWSFIEEWMTCGVAMCADVNSPISKNHPKRVGWRRHFSETGYQLEFVSEEYVNGGCVGVVRAHLQFLRNWQRLSHIMANVIGGLDAAKIEGGKSIAASGFASCFDCSDQDALNAAIEATPEVPVSILPRSAMAFEPGAAMLPHALGSQKPWRRKFIRDALCGLPPTTADRAFWQVVDGSLNSMGKLRTIGSRGALTIGAAIGRIYRRR